MLGLTNRILHVQQASNPSKYDEDKQRLAGRQAEDHIENLLKELGGIPNCNIFRSLRVPDEFQTRRHEIDLIVLTNYGLYCIEVKNWAGKLISCKNGDFWEQRKTVTKENKTFSQQTQYPNPLSESKKKTNILRLHLLRSGVCLPESKCTSRVVLTNKSCKVDDTIKNDPTVIRYENLHIFALSFQQSYSTILTDMVVPSFFRGTLSSTQLQQIRGSLGQIGTWDVLQLNGGKKLIGDYKGCTEISVNRKEVNQMVFSHSRNSTTGTFWAVLGYSPTTCVTMYKREQTSWFTKEIVASVTLPYNHNIGFKIAGDTTEAKISANDIDTIFFST
uniref:uncharacterized protein LOC100184194 n=1 Tax=Ciona intestinalis TaxID=7719 RepID=UPI000180CA0A|nr:uncharacterized protein LOC100184194 [Ciona intestinalis]|eukprot:XP_018667590.1 uncharacterized protein LOC100184194 [Ciona intestinalis]